MPLGILCFQLVAHSFRKTWGWHGFLPIVVLDSRHPVPLSCSSLAAGHRLALSAAEGSLSFISLLECAVPKAASVTPLECAVAKTPCGRRGYFSPHPEGDADPEKCSAEGPLKFCL